MEFNKVDLRSKLFMMEAIHVTWWKILLGLDERLIQSLLLRVRDFSLKFQPIIALAKELAFNSLDSAKLVDHILRWKVFLHSIDRRFLQMMLLSLAQPT